MVVDRYAFSGVAFSSAKGLDLEWCRNPDIGLLTPDLVLFLDLSIDDAEKRGGFGDERYEKRELQIKVRDQFMKLKDDTWKVCGTRLLLSLFLTLHSSLMRVNPKKMSRRISGTPLKLLEVHYKIIFKS